MKALSLEGEHIESFKVRLNALISMIHVNDLPKKVQVLILY